MSLISISEKIYYCLTKLRIELKNIGSRFNNILILDVDKVLRPEYLQNNQGECVVIENNCRANNFSILIQNDGVFNLNLKSQYGKVIVASVKINNIEMLSMPQTCDHDNIISISIDVKHNQILQLMIIQKPIKIDIQYLLNNIASIYERIFNTKIETKNKQIICEIILNLFNNEFEDLALNNKKRLFDILYNNYENNIWALRRQINANQELHDKQIYEDVYYKILSAKGSWIGIGASFKSIPIFPHGIRGIFISDGAKIGKNTTIFQHVTIGSNMLKGSKHYGFPEIGDNVFIGVGSKIIGNVKINNNVRIGAGSIVVDDINQNVTVVPAKLRVKTHDSSDKNLNFVDNSC